MADPVAVDKEFEKRLSAELPSGFDPASLITLLIGLFADCFGGDEPPAPTEVVKKVKGMSLVQRGALTNRLVEQYMDDDGLKRRDARKKAQAAVQALSKVASDSTEQEQVAVAERALGITDPNMVEFI